MRFIVITFLLWLGCLYSQARQPEGLDNLDILAPRNQSEIKVFIVPPPGEQPKSKSRSDTLSSIPLFQPENNKNCAITCFEWTNTGLDLLNVFGITAGATLTFINTQIQEPTANKILNFLTIGFLGLSFGVGIGSKFLQKHINKLKAQQKEKEEEELV